MRCSNCKSQLPANVKFCPECGTAVPAANVIEVKQEIGKVGGTVIGQALDGDQLHSSLKSTTTQKIDSVESGGTVVGTSIGNAQQIGGQRQYGDTYNVGKIEGSTGVAIGKRNQVSVSEGDSAEELAKAFLILLQAVQAQPDSPEKAMAQTAVQRLEEEAKKGDQVDESQVEKWFYFLIDMVPDMRDVAVATFTNPIKGISTVFKKVAERAKAEKG